MAAITASDISLQMIQQLRVLDPAISAEPGTPERKIIDTLAIKVSESQVDLTALQGGLDIDSKFGSNLDSFLKLFNFGRQSATRATGFVTFSRGTSAAPLDIRIPTNTRAIAADPTGDIPFRTTFDVVLKAGQTTVVAPIECVIAGNLGNVAANRITTLTGVDGIYSVTNELPTSGGLDQEDDDALKVRFKNTVFRNVSGTYDQYLALAVATAFTTKATVIGPISRYREYIQVPSVDDATVDPDNTFGGNDASGAGRYTSALSSIPYSKWVYSTVPYFVSDGKLGADAQFFRADTDYVLNTDATAKNKGDAYRESQEHAGVSYYDPTADANAYRPNVTFLNVYTGTVSAVQGVRPGDVLLFEHSYMSSASRNDWTRNVTNAVDVFIDGGNDTVANCVIPQPTSANLFVDDPTHRYHFENYRRDGEAEHRPVIGNAFTPLFFQPVTSLPDTITVNGVNYYLGSHYWLVEDVSELHGTVRARNGIEWDKYLPGQQTDQDPTDPSVWTGPTIIYGDDATESASVAPPMEITGYEYDKNINDLQAAFDSNKQTTTDPLAHKASVRHIRLDLTVMYSPGVSVTDVNNDIRTAVSDFLSGQYFGATIQLADLLKVVHSLSSVDNVRWSRDVPTTLDEIDQRRNRVVAVNSDGSSRLNVVVDRIVTGSTGRYEQLGLYVTGSPSGGTFQLYRPSSPSTQTAAIAYAASAATVQSQLRTLTGDASLVVSGSGTAASPWIVTYSTLGLKPEISLYASALTGGPTILNTDFFLTDDELPALPDGQQPGDTVPGLILRPRAQNTWVRGNV